MEQQLSFPMRVMLTVARERADIGIARAAAATERRTPGWCASACEELRKFVQRQDGLFTIELARLAFEKKIPDPEDLRSWGRVTRMARDRGYIVRVLGSSFPAASSHGSEKPVYRRGPGASKAVLTKNGGRA